MKHYRAVVGAVSNDYSFSAGFLAKQSTIRTSQRSTFTTLIGLVGGGRWPRPGEISLSHRGVLFLDELLEFGQTDLDVLRQPMEDKVVTISRALGSVTFPANLYTVTQSTEASTLCLAS